MVYLYHVNTLPKFERNRCALACVYRLSAECCLKIGGICDPILAILKNLRRQPSKIVFYLHLLLFVLKIHLHAVAIQLIQCATTCVPTKSIFPLTTSIIQKKTQGLHPVFLAGWVLQFQARVTGCSRQRQGKPEFLVPGNKEATRQPGNSGNRKEITRKLPEFSRKLGLPMSAMLRWATRGEKITNFFPFWFPSGNPRKNLVFWSIYGKTVYYYQEFTRKLLEFHPESGSGNYLEGTRDLGLPWPARSFERFE
jgi:hypothetical protein